MRIFRGAAGTKIPPVLYSQNARNERNHSIASRIRAGITAWDLSLEAAALARASRVSSVRSSLSLLPPCSGIPVNAANDTTRREASHRIDLRQPVALVEDLAVGTLLATGEFRRN